MTGVQNQHWLLKILDYPLLQLLFRLGLGALFLYAALPKILEPAAFVKDINNYRILPLELIPTMAVVLPFIELVAGVCLILGIFTRSAAFIITGLLVVFTIAIIITLARGIDISCGCFGSDNSSPIQWYTILRDTSLIIPGLILIFRDGGKYSIYPGVRSVR